MEMVQSLGALVRMLWKGEVAVASANRLETFAEGLCAMLMAAVAVSVGAVPVEPLLFALLNRVLQPPEVGPLELMQEARMSARVLISDSGTVPLPPAVVETARPLPRLPMLAAVAAAICMAVAAAVVFDPEMWMASVAKPARA